jgi:hypothetical protein
MPHVPRVSRRSFIVAGATARVILLQAAANARNVPACALPARAGRATPYGRQNGLLISR